MKVRNNYTTTIGVGSLTILPDAVAELPEAYGKKHPVIAYYLSRNWLTEVDAKPAEPDENSGNGGESGTSDNTGENAKPLSRLSVGELKALAAELGLEVGEKDTQKILLEKIKTAKEKSGESGENTGENE